MEKTWTGREVMHVMVEHPGVIYCPENKVLFVLWDNVDGYFVVSSRPEGLNDVWARRAFRWPEWTLDATWREWKPEPKELPLIDAIGEVFSGRGNSIDRTEQISEGSYHQICLTKDWKMRK